jgi:hypothetical protein
VLARRLYSSGGDEANREEKETTMTSLYLVTPTSLLKSFILQSDREYFSRPIPVLPVPYTGDTMFVCDPHRGHTYPVNPSHIVPSWALSRRLRKEAA